MTMTTSKPYLIRAIYEWIVDNRLTPYIVVDAMVPEVAVPERFIENGRIILNISPEAVAGLLLANEAIEFDATFQTIPCHVYAPTQSILAIYAYENGRGMMFQDEEGGEGGGGDGKGPEPQSPKTPPKGKPQLKVVK